MAQVLLERPSDAIAIVRLNRPEVRNALNLTIRQEMAEIFRTLAEDRKLRCVVLTGNDQAFAAGADIADMSQIDTIEMFHRHTERLWAAGLNWQCTPTSSLRARARNWDNLRSKSGSCRAPAARSD